METKPASITNRSYEDFDPVCKSRREEGRDTIELHLPGFKREQIRIQINHLGFMVISGERPLDGSRWRRFKKQVKLPNYCNVDAIHGNFAQSFLTVVMPKKIPPAIRQEEEEEELEKLQIPAKFEHKKKKVTYESREFGERGNEESTETTAKGELREDYNDVTRGYRQQLVENDDVVELAPDVTREVALKFMIVIFVILVIASYLADMSKSLMAHAQSYFH